MWCLLIAFCVPQLGATFRSARMCFFKSSKKPTFAHFMIVFLTETAHTIGIAILVFYVLPDLDVVKGAMLTNCLCFVPAVFGLLSRSNKESQRFIKVIIDLVAIACQATGLVAWPIIEQKPQLWLVPVSIFLISIGWWENYVSKHSPIPFIKKLGKLKTEFGAERYFTHMFVSVWKCLCFLLSIMFILLIKEGEFGFFFQYMSDGFGKHAITIQEVSLVSVIVLIISYNFLHFFYFYLWNKFNIV